MDVTILGASAAAQNPSGACSSYLLRQGATTVVVDMGSGAFANLQRHVAPDEVDAVVISHMHADHVLDLVPYRYWLAFKEGSPAGRPRLLLPPEGHQKLLGVSALQDPSPTFFADVFDVAEYDPAAELALGDLRFTFQLMRHAPHTYGMRICGAGTLAYSADTGPSAGVVDLARDADLFICENANPADSDFAMHLKPREAGAYAREAGARRLILTHRWHLCGLDVAAREAAEVFDGPISIAREGDTYHIGA